MENNNVQDKGKNFKDIRPSTKRTVIVRILTFLVFFIFTIFMLVIGIINSLPVKFIILFSILAIIFLYYIIYTFKIIKNKDWDRLRLGKAEHAAWMVGSGQ